MKVAVWRVKHSMMFGHRAFWQTVVSPNSSNKARTVSVVPSDGIRFFNHGGKVRLIGFPGLRPG
jgi:hypothetical protein